MPFLTARWSNLCLLTYAVPPRVLTPRLAPGLELDTRDGDAFVSLVAFDFHDTRVLDVAWPGFRAFPEINLRFYVRRGQERGVMFIREFVPQRWVAALARALYHEPYVRAPMQSHIEHTPQSLAVSHRLTFAGQTHTLRVTGDKPASCPADDSIEHFFKEHRWGFGRTRGGKCIRYEVVHPTWNCYTVRSWELKWNWSAVYGEQFAFLQDAAPCSIVLAAGSEIAVSGKTVMT